MTITKNLGMLLLAIYLILVGITLLVHIAIPVLVTGVLALAAGILILIGKQHARGLASYRTPTAREISKTTILSEIKIWIIARTFAQRASSGASVGPNVELCVKATNR